MQLAGGCALTDQQFDSVMDYQQSLTWELPQMSGAEIDALASGVVPQKVTDKLDLALLAAVCK